MQKQFFTFACLVLALAGCATQPSDISDNGEPMAEGDDLPLGDQLADDKADRGGWGSATTCKEIPDLPVLPHPQIVISIHGLTLHLFDTTVGYDKVFPIGPGAINQEASSSIRGESRSFYPLRNGTQDFVVDRSRSTACKMWWTDPDTGAQSPVFAGLPFLSWSGSYGIHGPIDNYRAPNGGNLRRGFVSHGCVRMESADILEVYARTIGVRLPVHVQREPERNEEGVRTDLAKRWVGAECSADSECNFDGGFCHANEMGGRGFCTMRCTSSCADRAGAPETFCIADPSVDGQGMCVPKASGVDYLCRPYDHFIVKTMPRNNQPRVTASVCIPGSPGWIGDRCEAASDCRPGLGCEGGVCTQSCTNSCADLAGYATTTCVDDPNDRLGDGGACARRCIPTNNGAECSADSACVSLNRNATATPVNVCIPVMSLGSLIGENN